MGVAEEGVTRDSMVLLDYTLIDRTANKVLETTSESVAKEAGAYSESATYGPRLVAIGAGDLPAGLEEALLGAKDGEEREVALSPERAFGNRKPERVRVISARELSTKGIVPRVGMEIEVRNERGVIVSVGSGRVIVDFNHPLAGKEVVYKVRVVKMLRTTEERVQGLVDKHLKKISGVEVALEGGDVVLKIPFESLRSAETLSATEGLAGDLDRYVKEVSSLKLLVNAYSRKVEEKAP